MGRKIREFFQNSKTQNSSSGKTGPFFQNSSSEFLIPGICKFPEPRTHAIPFLVFGSFIYIRCRVRVAVPNQNSLMNFRTTFGHRLPTSSRILSTVNNHQESNRQFASSHTPYSAPAVTMGPAPSVQIANATLDFGCLAQLAISFPRLQNLPGTPS